MLILNLVLADGADRLRNVADGAKVTSMYAVSTSQPTRHGSDDWEMGEAVSAATAHGNAALDKWQDF